MYVIKSILISKTPHLKLNNAISYLHKLCYLDMFQNCIKKCAKYLNLKNIEILGKPICIHMYISESLVHILYGDKTPRDKHCPVFRPNKVDSIFSKYL